MPTQSSRAHRNAPCPKGTGSASSSRRANACTLQFPVRSCHKYSPSRVGCRDSRQHLPWGLGPFGGIGSSDRCVLAYHPSTIRSQSFSPSQRFSPTRTLWFCFTPHPPIGFLAYRAFPSQPAVTPSGVLYSPAVRPAPARFGKPDQRFCRLLQLLLRSPLRSQ